MIISLIQFAAGDLTGMPRLWATALLLLSLGFVIVYGAAQVRVIYLLSVAFGKDSAAVRKKMIDKVRKADPKARPSADDRSASLNEINDLRVKTHREIIVKVLEWLSISFIVLAVAGSGIALLRVFAG